MNSTPTRPVVYLVVGTLAFVVICYVATLSFCSIGGFHPDVKVLEYLKDAGLFASGSLGTILTQTKTQPDDGGTPVNTIVTNTPNNPVNITEQPNP